MTKAIPTGRVFLALSFTTLLAVVLAIGQVVPGPAPSTYTGIEGQCQSVFLASSTSQTTACFLLTPGVDYGFTPPPRHVPNGKILNITDVSVRCVSSFGGASGEYAVYAVLEADGYSKYLPLQSVESDLPHHVRMGMAPVAMTARAGSQVLMRAHHNKRNSTFASKCEVGFTGTLKNY